MNPQRLFDFLTGLGQAPARVSDFVQAAASNPALAGKLTAAMDADDNRAVLRLLADQQWGRAPLRDAPVAPEPTGIRSPMSFEERVVNDPNLRRAIEESGQAYPAGHAEAIMEAMRRGPVQRRGRPKKATTEDSIRELAKPPEPPPAPERIAAEFEEQINPRSRESAPELLRMPDEGVMDAAPPEMYPRGTIQPKRKPQVGMSGRDVASAAGVGAVIGGATQLGLNAIDPPGSTTADLAEDSRPAPKVEATPEVPQPTVAQAPRDYSMEARALINRLNDMRRAAGGEVPEAKAMMAEINRLLELANQTRSATYVAAPQDDASRLYQQAQALIDQVNALYRQGQSPNSPEVQRLMADARRLQQQGDSLRNNPRPSSPPSRPRHREMFPVQRGGPRLIPNHRGLRPRSGPNTT